MNVWMCILNIAIAFGPVAAFAAPISAQISQSGETVHLEFSGLSQWDYNLQKNEKSGKAFYELLVPALSEKDVVELQSFKSPYFKSIKIDKQGVDGKYVLLFELAEKQVDSFDYLTDQPSRLIIDFFATGKKSEKPVAKTETKSQVKSGDKKETALPAKKNRAPASDIIVIKPEDQAEASAMALAEPPKNDGKIKMGIFDGGDPNFDRFKIKDYEIKEESIIASRENVYMDFPMLRMDLPYMDILGARRPVYEITPKDTEENKKARLLQTLFEKRRFNVFLKTIDWFLAKHPQSEYDEIIRFMWADTHFALWQTDRSSKDFDLAMLRYRQAVEKYPESPLVERTLMLMGFAALDRGDYLGTIRQFQNLIETRAQSPNKDIARLGMAEAFLRLNKFDEAIKEYDKVEKDSPTLKYKVQASYFRGDIHFKKRDYEQAIKEYQQAQKKYAASFRDFPNSYYNQAAAYFGLGQYKQSLDTYNEFIQNFPSHPYAGYAMTRVGELLDILGADKTRVMGAYLETFFRYGETPSSIVARLRLLSSRMNTMKSKDVEKAVKDIYELAKSSDLPRIEQFATLMIAEGYAKRSEYEKAVDLLVKYYQANPTTADTQLLASRIVKNINEELRTLVDKGQFIDALKHHNRYVDTWLKNSSRIDTKYNVGRAFEQAGVFSQAETLYKDTLNKVYMLKGTQAAKERNIFERLPSEDEINLRLAAIETQQGKFSQAYEFLKNVKSPEKLSDVEQIERVQLAAQLLEKKGDLDSAVRYLVELLKEWSGLPELVAEPYFHLAQLENKMGKTDDALESFQKVDVLMEDSKKVAPSTHAKSLEFMGDLELKKGNVPGAMKAYQKLLTNYEKTRPLASIRYKLGQLHFKKGEVQKAAEIWNDLKNEKNELWYRLAQEELKGSEWQGEYKKYINRIPAMVERK